MKALRSALPAVVEEFLRLAKDRGTESPFLRLLVACWDARQQRPRLFGISSLAGDFAGQTAPDGLMELQALIGDRQDCSHLWQGKTPCDPRYFDPDTGPIEAMERGRSIPYAPPVGGPVHRWIGGEIEQAVITRRGVQLFSLHKWNDRVGERIAA